MSPTEATSTLSPRSTSAPTRIGVSTGMLKMLTRGPGVLVSTVLTCLVRALLPPWAGLCLFVGGLVTAGLLATGRCEPQVLRLRYGARSPTPWEALVLAPAGAVLTHREMGPPDVRLYVRECGGVGAWAAGRHGVVVSTGLVEKLDLDQIDEREAAALLTFVAGLLRSSSPRFDLVLEFWTLPWQLMLGVGTAIGAMLATLPLVEFAWRIRFVVATIAVVQSISAGRVASGVLIAGFVAATYLVPRWRRAWIGRVEKAADRFVCERGLAKPWATFLAGQSGSPTMRARLHRITGTTQLPGVALVPAN